MNHKQLTQFAVSYLKKILVLMLDFKKDILCKNQTNRCLNAIFKLGKILFSF